MPPFTKKDLVLKIKELNEKLQTAKTDLEIHLVADNSSINVDVKKTNGEKVLVVTNSIRRQMANGLESIVNNHISKKTLIC